VDGARLYASNAVAMWAGLAPVARMVPGTPPGVAVVDLPVQRTTRIILRRPGAARAGQFGALLAAAGRRGRVVVEDSFGDLMLPVTGEARAERNPLMLRAAGHPAPRRDGADARVVPVADRDALAQAERVIVDGFPRTALQPFAPGRMLPVESLTVPGLRTWLAYHGAEPAAACCTCDDGAALGVYWLATLPEHRSLGLGRAVMAAALGASPGRPAVLIATAAGEPLYSSLGFAAVAEATWYRFPPSH
jgi:GNAT superfamily N-acetyltransferase